MTTQAADKPAASKKPMMPLPSSLLVAVGFALLGSAQQLPSTSSTSVDEVLRQVEVQLSSGDTRTIAWGAYTAGAYHLTKAIPLLQSILESPLPVSAGERRAFLDVILDSLLQLNARLPASLLVRYVDERPVQTVALLANATDRDQVLLDLLPKTSAFQWYAVANMLLDVKTRSELAAYLLQTLHLHLTVTVSDGQPRRFGHGDASGIGIGDGIGQDPKGYPPHAQYRFEDGSRPGHVVISSGPHPVYYSREVSTFFQYGVSELDIGGPTDADRLAYLYAMLGPGYSLALSPKTADGVKWTTASALIKRIEELRADIQRVYRLLVEDLDRWYPLASDVLRLPANIDVQLIDERTDRSIPLPPVR
jgi:hypothetical protein